jgi:hypothetical protein
MKHLARSRTVIAVAAIILICGAASAGAAAKLITGADVKDGSLTGKDVKNGSLTGKDVKNGSLSNAELNAALQSAIPTRVTAGLPTNSFRATNPTVKNTKDGVKFGPYADGGQAGGSLCTNSLNGKPLSDVKHLAFEARYTATGDTGGVGVPYLRIFLQSPADHDAIFSPNTQPPDSDTAEGPFHTWVATAGLWRYDDDGDTGGQYGHGAPFGTVKQDHGTEKISDLCISTGFSAGADLTALLRSWEINAGDYSFGL